MSEIPAKKNEIIISELSKAAVNLKLICDAIDSDDHEDLPKVITEIFAAERLQLAVGVDEFIETLSQIDGAITHAKQLKAHLNERQKKLEETRERLVSRGKEVVDKAGVPFQGTYQKLAVQKNPPTLETDFPLQSTNVQNIVDEKIVEFLDIPKEMLVTKQFLTINKNELKAQLKAGKEFPWVRMNQEKSLRIK